MHVQRVAMPASPVSWWTVLGDDDVPVEPIERFLGYLSDIERSPNTVRAYAYDLKDYWVFLVHRGLDWREVRLEDIGEFIAWLRLPPAGRDGAVAVLPSVQPRVGSATINRKLSALAAFYQHQVRHGVDVGELLITWQLPGRRGGWKPFLHHVAKDKPQPRRTVALKAPRKLPRVLTVAEIQAILGACTRLRDRLDGAPSQLRFDRIGQPWLKQLAKRWVRWRLSSGLSTTAAARCVVALSRFAVFLADPGQGVERLADIDRVVLERYLARLHVQFAGRPMHRTEIGLLNSFLQAIRQHRWDLSLPATATFYPEDYPKLGEQLPRAVAEHVMTQIESAANLDRWDNPAYRLVTIILIHCGLRVSDALKVAFDCVALDAEAAPYLRYYNHKMNREALVPIDDQLHRLLGEQQQRVLARRPAGPPLLFPRSMTNREGDKPIGSGTYRGALYRWLRRCDIRDEHGRPVHLTPHQWRHSP